MAKKKQQSEDQKPDRTKKVPFQRQLSCHLTREEVEQRADESARLVERRDHFEAELKSAQKSGKAQLSEMDAELRRVSTEVRDKATVRLVDCDRVQDWDAGTVTEVRRDTGEVISSRKMTDEEKQRELDLGDGDVDKEFDDQ